MLLGGIILIPLFLMFDFIEKINEMQRISPYREMILMFFIVIIFFITLYFFRCTIEYTFKRFRVEFDTTPKWYIIYARIFCFLLPFSCFHALFFQTQNLWQNDLSINDQRIMEVSSSFFIYPLLFMLSFHLFSRWFRLVFIKPTPKPSKTHAPSSTIE